MRKRYLIHYMITLLLGITLLVEPAFAEENVSDLKAQIEALQKRVEELESAQTKEQQTPQTQQGFPFHHRSNRFWGDRWNPFEEINRMQEEMDHMFQNSFGRSGGRSGMFSSNMSFDTDFELKETDNGYEIRFDLTGLDKEKVDIEINEHSITVKGEHSRQDTEEGPNRYFSSQSYGSFMKTIPLPMDADTAKMKTEKEGDTLVIRLPKKNT